MPDRWCEEHKAVFFKKGNMRGYAHPIKDEAGITIGWCNEDKPVHMGDKTSVEPPSIKPTETPIVIKPEISPQEKGMFWKEVGENFRAGLFKKDDKEAGTQLWAAYITQMLTSLEIKLTKKMEENKLVQEVKKLGAKEIKEGE